jgi:putative YD repeat containing protein
LKNMVVVSDDYVGIESIGEMAIYGDNINVIGKAKDIRIEASGEIRMKGQKIHNN